MPGELFAKDLFGNILVKKEIMVYVSDRYLTFSDVNGIIVHRVDVVDVYHIRFAYPDKDAFRELVKYGFDIHARYHFLGFGVHDYIVFKAFNKKYIFEPDLEHLAVRLNENIVVCHISDIVLPMVVLEQLAVGCGFLNCFAEAFCSFTGLMR